jgi:hypothetical protein
MTITTETLRLAAKLLGREVIAQTDGTFWQNYRGVGLKAWQPHLDGNDAGELARKLHMLLHFASDESGTVTALRQFRTICWPQDCANWMEAVVLCAAEVQC